ncbi:MAG: hypothetical protein RMK18_11905 [Armatimonadota bacterium]|nr:hypothetical protein [Armatimonadota bacterium]
MLEFFSDEFKLRCKCGTIVIRENQPTCAEWCPYAEQCLAGVLSPEQFAEIRKRREERMREENTEFFEKVKALCERASELKLKGGS